MSAARHRLFVPPAQLGASEVTLTSGQARYLETVLRLERGAEIEVFDGEGGLYRARLAAPGRLHIEDRMPQQARAPDVVLAQALAKGEKFDVVVQKATELGAMRLLPLASERAVVRLDEARGQSRAERWRRIAEEAARQCGRADVPRIDPPCGWEGVFSLLRDDPGRRGLLLDPEERELRLGAAARGAPKLLLLVGPEGGFSPGERDRARAEGILPVALGPLVLRTETAGLAALAVVLHVHGELG
ncbi:MAG: 16S rRNA (uracil(1498)-N(3))-methyltransferase [Deltaproteobacteria bacterium]